MTGPGPSERCARLARALDEPLAGTAPTAARWLCLEHPQPWPRDITRHPDPEIRSLLERAVAHGFRPLLVRGRPHAGPRQALLADTDPEHPAITAQPVPDLALPAPGAPLTGEPVSGAALLICAHAERDPCCGDEGRGLAEALAAAGEPGVWQCSHLGGHRFAPTALVLPTGYLYGRLDPAAAVAVRAAAAAGEVIVDRCRGRSTWTPRGQVAELAVRAACGLRGAAELAVADNDDDVLVTDRAGRSWAVDVSSPDADALRPASCGARPTLMTPLRADAVRLRPTPR